MSGPSSPSANAAVRTCAFQLDRRPGRRFCVAHEPAGAVRGAVLLVAPFAEEMNKSRRAMSVGARALAASGHIVLQSDLYGCGDSEGDFADAHWRRWIDDVVAAAEWLRERSDVEVVMWGVRAGALLALDAARAARCASRFVFWQPVVSGRQHLQQFLRLGVTAALMSDDSLPATTASLRARLNAGETLDIAGYPVSPALAEGLEAAELGVPPPPARAHWFEAGARADAALSAAAAQRVEQWRAAGVAVDARAVEAPPFWQTQEIAECPALVSATISALT